MATGLDCADAGSNLVEASNRREVVSNGGEQDDLVEISHQPLDLIKYINAVKNPGAGAVATFAGTTRDSFGNRQVLELQYEAFVPMAYRQLRAICKDARKLWSLISVAVAHRVGVVPIGEESVFVAASSVHRKDALEACHYIIDEIKASVPIWKKEVYVDGEVWKENAEFAGEKCCHSNW
eukprot:c20091_g1_i1 orf=395-934(-)